jgi:roundabout axon guidance receptor 2
MFVIKPQDQKIGMGGSASFECVARGNPPPSVFWNKEGSQAIMFPGNKYGRMDVSSEAVLTINDVVREDSGYVVCSALSLAGSATARAFLQVGFIAEIKKKNWLSGSLNLQEWLMNLFTSHSIPAKSNPHTRNTYINSSKHTTHTSSIVVVIV